MIDDITKDVSNIHITVAISKVILVGFNYKELWIDIGATRHVCSSKKMFSTYKLNETREKVFMGNFAS